MSLCNLYLYPNTPGLCDSLFWSGQEWQKKNWNIERVSCYLCVCLYVCAKLIFLCPCATTNFNGI